jgi:hypothetical protein
MICPACGTRNRRTSRVCVTCGTVLSSVPRTQFRYEQALLDRRRTTVQRKPRIPSTVALVLGLAALTPLTFITGIPAIILAAIALKKHQPGRGMAYTGLVTGAFGTLVLTFVLLLPMITWQRELHRVALVKQNMQAYRAALDDYATDNEGRYPRPGISWEKEDEDGMVLHFKTETGLLTSIPFNPYTRERYRKGRDFFYLPEYLGETELNAVVDRDNPRCPFAGLAAPGGVPGTIVILGWSPTEFHGSPIEYAVFGYGRNTAEPIRRGRNYLVLHN